MRMKPLTLSYLTGQAQTKVLAASRKKIISHGPTQRGRAATKFLWVSMSFFAHADISLQPN